MVVGSANTTLPTPLPVGPELFIGLVAPVGTDHDYLTSVLEDLLKTFNYKTRLVRAASLLHAYPRYSKLATSPVDEYIRDHQWAGDDFRKITKRNDALAALAIAQIEGERQKETGEQGKIIHRCAYIIRSIKTPQEVDRLRGVYGNAFILIGSSAPHEIRKRYLAQRIAHSRSEFNPEEYFDIAEALIKTDQHESEKNHGQNLRGAFHRSDIFVDARDPQVLRASLSRALELLFGYPFHTPTKDEYGTFHARAAALRSSELGRQVGAAIATKNGDIIAVGTNEVPKSGGGSYWAGDSPDRREFQIGFDSNDVHKRALLEDLLLRLREDGWLAADKAAQPVSQLAQAALDPERNKRISGSQLTNLIEFMRAVHAEMSAITDASRRGAPVAGSTMYVTTFPCHLCAPHIVAAGITRVVYVEPYAKSLAAQLYPDSISLDGAEISDKVSFEPFVGIAPSRYMDWFKMLRRKNNDGTVVKFDPPNALPRIEGSPRAYMDNEQIVIGDFQKLIEDKEIKTQLQEVENVRPGATS